MKAITTIAIYVVLTACTGLAAQAQQAPSTGGKPFQVQRDAAVQPFGSRAGELLRLGADTTRQEFECVMSGVCSASDRGRVAS